MQMKSRIRTAEESLRLYKHLYSIGYGNINTVVDVGVESSTTALINAFPDAHHYLFEPATIFNEDIAENYKDIPHTLINVALSDHTRTEVISGEGRRYLREVGDIETQFTTLDTYFNDKPELWSFDTLVKIDVDGLELEIIRGGANFLQSIGMVMLEVTTFGLASHLLQMEKIGFLPWDITNPGYYDDQFHQCDVMFLNQTLRNSVDNSAFRPWDKPFSMSKWRNGETDELESIK
jgi:FkbM family methyltransferase